MKTSPLVNEKPAAKLPAWHALALKDVECLRQLKENWDGYGAAPSRPDLLASALNFLHLIAAQTPLPAPCISPTRTGGVLFEWENGPHQLEAQIISADVVSFVYLNQETDASVTGTLSGNRSDEEQFLQLAQKHFAS